MDKAEFIKKYHEVCNSLGLAPNQALVSAGGACLMLGLRDKSEDIDLDIPAEVFDWILKSRKHKVLEALDPKDKVIVWSDSVDLHRMSESRDWMKVEGVGLYSLNGLIEQKERMAKHPQRKPHKIPQDLHDIQQLKHLKATFR